MPIKKMVSPPMNERLPQISIFCEERRYGRLLEFHERPDRPDDAEGDAD